MRRFLRSSSRFPVAFRQTRWSSLSAARPMSTHLTPERREVIAATAPVVAANVSKIVPTFYKTMFENNPEVFAFFNKANQRNSKQPEALAHAVLASVSHLDDLGAIESAATMIAHKHCALGVLPAHYQIVHDNFLAATAATLGDAVTPAVADAWSGVLLHLADHFVAMETALYDETTARLDNWDAREIKEFRVRSVDKSADNIASVLLERVDGGQAPSYLPGQYISFCANPTDEPLFAPRHYTIAAPQPIDNALRIVVKRVGGLNGAPPGIMSNYIYSQLKAGDVVGLRAPFGVFTTKAAEKFGKVAYITAGCGVTPAMAMLDPLAESGKQVVHYHIDSQASNVPKVDHSRVHANIDYFDHGAGDITSAKIAADLKQAGVDILHDDTVVFLCAPPGMITQLRDGLVDLGVPKERIEYENFGPRTA